MAQFHTDELEYMVDDYYGMDEFDDNPFADNREVRNSDDSDFEDDIDTSKQKNDTSADEARNGKDIQGIPWERLNFTRDRYRETRLKQYKNYESLSLSREELDKECKSVDNRSAFYDFQFNTRIVKSTIVHFQVPVLPRTSSLISCFCDLVNPFDVDHCKRLLAFVCVTWVYLTVHFSRR